MNLVAAVQPDAPTGRTWARDELSQPIYHPHRDPIAWLMDKITGFFDRLSDSAAGGQTGLWIIIAVVIAVAVVLIVVMGPMRRARHIDDASLSLTDQTASARELRAHADTAYRAADYQRALILSFRAMTQDGIERLLISPLPGLTAHEAAGSLTRAFPHLTDQLILSAQTFDAVAYNDQDVSAGEARAALEFCSHLARTRAEHIDDDLVLATAEPGIGEPPDGGAVR
ncbi:DUF4129 domain-containing protein [Rarobacter faecitabidus]|uniref:Uncharacterized protein DUF4129 n=1 Tax=Rarobacter faecitabidus TaxID=13243 RepID=A0A542ZUA4_RARFA|nr:DUF4129 domain-containing protein [Rarobacter faecitabidus]TQL63922.1 uncharacterized protein DUF4129 [Rarobacter faecitabidus]